LQFRKPPVLIAGAVLVLHEANRGTELLQPSLERIIHQACGADNRQPVSANGGQHGKRHGEGAGTRFHDLPARL